MMRLPSRTALPRPGECDIATRSDKVSKRPREAAEKKEMSSEWPSMRLWIYCGPFGGPKKIKPNAITRSLRSGLAVWLICM
jgi:hypothetical protein